MDTEPKHKDILGNPIVEGSILAVSHRNMLKVCCIENITSKMLRVAPINSRRKQGNFLVYPYQTIVLEGPDVVAYILKA